MQTDPSVRHPVEELAEEFVARFRRGERPAVDEYVARYPELAGEISQILHSLVLMENLGRSDGDVELAASADQSLSQLGEFRIVREIGRGGMGIVYEAEQASLGRHVALKVLPSSLHNDATRLERFRREARTAARLHHTNIVPVYGVGEHSGRLYYAMQYIAGHGLDAVLREVKLQRTLPGDVTTNGAGVSNVRGAESGNSATTFLSGTSTSTPNYFRRVAQIGLQVAEALAYAHAQGILHRDIKPSNLLLDHQGTVWVTDFGLAKADEVENLTSTGDIVGTLRYMPPERFAGQSEARGDIYALGLTVYEMLTLRPAFDEPDRGA